MKQLFTNDTLLLDERTFPDLEIHRFIGLNENEDVVFEKNVMDRVLDEDRMMSYLRENPRIANELASHPGPIVYTGRFRHEAGMNFISRNSKEMEGSNAYGIFLEKFNLDLESDATIEADYAYYDEPAQVWMLRGNVKALNLNGEQFETPLLFWSQKDESVYSDSSIVITREASIIKGVGFRSNQSMTQYTILKPTGVIPINE